MLIIACQLESFRSLKDRTLKLSLETQEPTPDQLQEIARISGQFGYLAFKLEPFKKDETDLIESLKTDFIEFGKSPSQVLRAVIFRNYETKNEGYKTFEEFYRVKMEQIINHFKSKL